MPEIMDKDQFSRTSDAARIETAHATTGNPGCGCGSPKNTQPFSMLSNPVPAQPACCGSPKEGNPGGVVRGVNRSRFRMLGGAGLLAAMLVFFSFGILPTPSADAVWPEIRSNLLFVGRAAWSILPLFVVSVLISGWVTVSGFSERVKTVFARKEMVAIPAAALVGATVPICSCGVIPLIAALLAGGIPLGPVMAFWLSSPLMSPEMFLLTAGMLGMDYAVGRLLAAILIGVVAGYLTYVMALRGVLDDQLSLPDKRCCGSEGATVDLDTAGAGNWRNFLSTSGSVSLFLGKWLLVAFILESLIVHYVDPAWISAMLGKNQPFSIPLATAVGIPLYTSGVAAIPIVKGLVENGMSQGAAMAFLIAGPVTTIPAMAAVFALVKRRTFIIYLGVGIVGSLVSGYLFQMVVG